MNNANGQSPISVSLSDTKPLGCANTQCDNETFVSGARLGRLSAVHPDNPTGKDVVIPFETFVCAACGAEPNYTDQ